MAGLSTEVRHKGAAFYIQTQDAGPRTRCIESLIYASGRLLTSRKTSYTPFLGNPDLVEKIRELANAQHETILRDIREGKFDHLIPPAGGRNSG